MLDIKELLNQYKRQSMHTNEYIASYCGVNKSTVSRWCSGQTRRLQPEAMEKLSQLLQVDLEELTGDAFNLERPILGTVKAGYGLMAEENLEGYQKVSREDYESGDFFLRVTGDSMIGAKIHDQDLIYVRACRDVPSNTIAVVLIGGEEVSVKKVIKKNDYWILQAANPEVEPRIFTYKEITELPVQIIGKVLYARTEIN